MYPAVLLAPAAGNTGLRDLREPEVHVLRSPSTRQRCSRLRALGPLTVDPPTSTRAAQPDLERALHTHPRVPFSLLRFHEAMSHSTKESSLPHKIKRHAESPLSLLRWMDLLSHKQSPFVLMHTEHGIQPNRHHCPPRGNRDDR